MVYHLPTILVSHLCWIVIMDDPWIILADGKCSTCSQDIDDNEHIECFKCGKHFHALCKQLNSSICNKSLLATFLQKSTKRNFVWYCDRCMTNIELSTSNTESLQAQKVKEMDGKIDILTAKVSSLTDMLNPSLQATGAQGVSAPLHLNGNNDNVWNNASKVTILKNSSGVSPNLNQLEERIVGDKINVTNSKRLTNGNVVITCPSTTAANKIKDLAVQLLPQHTVRDPQVNYSWINVVGFETKHDCDSVYNLLVKNNLSLDSLKGKSVEEGREFLEVKAVKPCIKNPSIHRALVRVSNTLRNVIKLGNDKLKVGLYLCRVYDQAPQIKRCNKCQRYGHWVANCDTQNGKACAKCASTDHETIQCTVDVRNGAGIGCINCKREGIVQLSPPHMADSSNCPCFVRFRKQMYSNSQQTSSRQPPQTGNTQQSSQVQSVSPPVAFYPGTPFYNTSFPAPQVYMGQQMGQIVNQNPQTAPVYSHSNQYHQNPLATSQQSNLPQSNLNNYSASTLPLNG